MVNLIGFHFVDNIYHASAIAQHFELLRKTRPAAINILGGAQYAQALAFAVAAKREFPDMRVIFRHYRDGGDDGMHTRLTPEAWWSNIGSLYRGLGLTILTDNESMSADLRPYARWQSNAMRLAAGGGVALAVGRFATGNPREDQYADGQLDEMFDALDAWYPLHIFSPNCYYSTGSSADVRYHLQRPFLGLARCKKPVTMVIGEFGLAHNFDPHAGWKTTGMRGVTYGLQLERLVREVYAARSIPVCVYSVGAWPIDRDTFGIDNEVINTLTNNPVPSIVLVRPDNPGASTRIYLFRASGGTLNLRSGPGIEFTDIGDIALSNAPDVASATPLLHYPATKRQGKINSAGALGDWYFCKLDNEAGTEGWFAHLAGIDIRALTPADPPAPPAPEPPDDIELLKMRVAALEKQVSELKDIEARLIFSFQFNQRLFIEAFKAALRVLEPEDAPAETQTKEKAA